RAQQRHLRGGGRLYLARPVPRRRPAPHRELRLVHALGGGTYRWRAAYSGDANYTAVTSACNAANESSVVGKGAPTITTSATGFATFGQPVSDTATVTGVSGGPAPTGTVTFTAFGPNNATCAGAAAFTSPARSLAGGPPPIANS